MVSTLKKRYDTRKIQNLQERTRIVDKQIINEARVSELLVEAMNEDDLKKASAIIDKLRNIKGKGLQSLDAAIEQAEAELNKYTGGGPLTKAWAKIKSKVGIDNPVVKIMTFANALETGFKQLPIILKNNIGALNKEQAEQTITELIPDEEKRKTVLANILKALSPGGIFGAFKKVPYVDKNVLSTDILNTPLGKLNATIAGITRGTQTSEIAADIKDTAQQAGGAETKGTQPGAPPVPAAGTAGQENPPKSSTVSTGATPTGETPPRTGQSDIKAKVIAKVKPALEDLGIKNIDKVIAALEDMGVLKEPSA